MKTSHFPERQNGAALVVGLILLVIVTVLAIAGTNTATTELAMARNNQNYENAFQAAETGLETAIARSNFDTTATGVTLNPPILDTGRDHDTVVVRIEFEDTTIVPDKAFSLGAGSGIAAYHFNATATAESARAGGIDTDRDASAEHTQAFYVVGPGSPTL